MDNDPISTVDKNEFFKTPGDLKAALIGCYNGLQGSMFYEWQLTELRTDNSRIRTTGSTSSNTIALMQFDRAMIGSDHERVYKYWVASYATIGRCNEVLLEDHISIITDSIVRRQTKGQAQFLRAYNYFNLVRLFGPVFLIDTPLSAAEAKKQPRIPTGEIYAFIEDDLKLAIDSLPYAYSDAGDKGRVTRWAAKAMLAKVYLTQQRFTDAETILAELVEGAGVTRYRFNINDISYDKIFSEDNEMNPEILFAVRYKQGGLGLGNLFGNQFAPSSSGEWVINGDGDEYNYPTREVARAFTETYRNADGDIVELLDDAPNPFTDKRKDVTMKEYYTNPTISVPRVERQYCCKYISPVIQKYDGERDWPVLRWADVILMYAEVLNEINGPTQKVYNLINQTRTRAGYSIKVEEKMRDFEYIGQTITRNMVRLEIELERRREFAFENQRWFDLVRTNRAIEVMNRHYQTEPNEPNSTVPMYYEDINSGVPTLEPKYLILPIPQKERDANPNISQNPGY
jgi:hypothetical protein